MAPSKRIVHGHRHPLHLVAALMLLAAFLLMSAAPHVSLGLSVLAFGVATRAWQLARRRGAMTLGHRRPRTRAVPPAHPGLRTERPHSPAAARRRRAEARMGGRRARD